MKVYSIEKGKSSLIELNFDIAKEFLEEASEYEDVEDCYWAKIQYLEESDLPFVIGDFTFKIEEMSQRDLDEIG